METVTADPTCQYCRYCVSDECGWTNICRKSRKLAKSAEGVTYVRSELSCNEALIIFRASNDGKCPYFKRSIPAMLVGFVDRLLGVE